jgi:DNA-binding MarR family transcriptional regulator
MSNRGKNTLIRDLSNAVRAMQRATDSMDQATTDYCGINRTDGHCLDLLHERGAMTAGQLAEHAGLSPGAITTVLDRLEAHDYVRRVRDPADRRRVMVEITERMLEITERLYGPLAQAVVWLRRYSEEELSAILEFVVKSTEVQQERAAEIRALPPLDDAGPAKVTSRSGAKAGR